MERRIRGELVEQEEQIVNKVDDKINKITIQMQKERDEDNITVTKNISNLSDQVKENRDQTNARLNIQDELIKEQNQKIDKHQHRIHTVEDRLEEYKHEANQAIHKLPLSHITVSCAGENYGRNIPKFHGKISNPQEYLEKLKICYDHSKKARYVGGEAENTECLIEVISSSMERSASQWWQLNKQKVNSWEQFVQIFHEKYWNKEIQSHLRQKIDLEKYRPGGYLSRTDYFLERILILKAMTPPISEEDIINILASHYDEVIQTARRVQNLNTITSFEMLLQREDMLDIQKNLQVRNRNKPEVRKNNQNNTPEHQNHPFNGRENFRAYQPKNQQQFREVTRPYEDRRQTFRNGEQPREIEHTPRTLQREPYFDKNQHNSYRFNNNKQRPNNNWNKESHDRSQHHYYNNNRRHYPSTEQEEVCNAIIRDQESEENKPIEKSETRVYTNSQYKSNSPQRSGNSLNY